MTVVDSCPKCQQVFRKRRFGPEISLDVCSGCNGIWCPGDDLEHLLTLPMVDVLDVGDARVGAVYNRVTNIDCPGCGTRMKNTRVTDQPHIGIEVCPGCSSVFLDAGELTDIRHITFGDWVKSMRIRLRFD